MNDITIPLEEIPFKEIFYRDAIVGYIGVENLVKTMRERDLVRKANKVHIVVDHKICRPSTIDGNRYRGERLWTKIGICKKYSEFKPEVRKHGFEYCEFCCAILEKNGYKQK